MSGQLYAPAALPSSKEPSVLIGLGEPQSQSGRLGEEKILGRYRDSNSDPSVVQLIASRYTNYAIPAPYKNNLAKD
jgi:hypothetical protein